MLSMFEVERIQKRIRKAERRIANGVRVEEETARVNRLISILFGEPLKVEGEEEVVNLP